MVIKLMAAGIAGENQQRYREEQQRDLFQFGPSFNQRTLHLNLNTILFVLFVHVRAFSYAFVVMNLDKMIFAVLEL